jgi:lysophospholipase L1-like esterase
MAKDPKSASPTPRKAWLIRLAAGLIVVGSTLLAFALLEIGLRVRHRSDGEAHMLLKGEGYYYTDISGRRHHIPGAVGKAPHFDKKGLVEYRVSPQGFLNEPLASPKPADEKRILFLGDSLVMAGHIHRQDTFVELLESKLAQQKVEVINAGIGDIGLTQIYEELTGKGIAAEPDAVILGVFLNDSRPPQGFRDELIYNHPWMKRLKSSPLKHSYLANFVVARLYKAAIARKATSKTQTKRFAWTRVYNEHAWMRDANKTRELVMLARYDWGAAWIKKEMELILAQIEKHRAFCAKRGLPFGVVLFPVNVQMIAPQVPALWAPQTAMKRWLTENNVPFVDLAAEMRGHNVAPLYYDHCHLTPRGHALAAEAFLPLAQSLLK